MEHKRRNLGNNMNDGVGAMDRISELPEVIIHHILSFLSTKAVAKTSLLSKRWKSFTISYPILEFNENYYQCLEKNEMHQPYPLGGQIICHLGQNIQNFPPEKMSSIL